MSQPRLSDFIKAYDVRGVVPEQLNEVVAGAIGSAFAQAVAIPEGASSIVVGHDMRPSSPALCQAFAQGAAVRGVDVMMIGLCSTDGLYYASGALGVPGAMFTASHNPARYNGIKMCRAGARPVGSDSGLDEVRDLAQSLLDEASAGEPNALEVNTNDVSVGRAERVGQITQRDVLADYACFLRSLVDLSAPDAGRRIMVVVDAGNGMGGHSVPAVLTTEAGLPALPLDVIPLFFELDGTFPNHEANPLEPANLRDLQAAVVQHGADIGLAFDGDADRCFVVDERGEPVSPSAITALVATREIAKAVAAGTPASDVTVAYNVISSRAVPEIIAEHGAQGLRTRVGHSFIKGEMARHDAVFGGEHSAHYYFREFWFADTGMLAALHVLAALGEQQGPLSELTAQFSRYVASGEINSTVSDVAGTTDRVRAWATEQDVTFDELDGLTISSGSGAGESMWWLNLRASNTEPLLRLNVEAADDATMAQIRDTVLSIVRATPSIVRATLEPASSDSTNKGETV